MISTINITILVVLSDRSFEICVSLKISASSSSASSPCVLNVSYDALTPSIGVFPPTLPVIAISLLGIATD
jgi:hypothetical protein